MNIAQANVAAILAVVCSTNSSGAALQGNDDQSRGNMIYQIVGEPTREHQALEEQTDKGETDIRGVLIGLPRTPTGGRNNDDGVVYGNWYTTNVIEEVPSRVPLLYRDQDVEQLRSTWGRFKAWLSLTFCCCCSDED
jgi:hypothetical protein